MLETLLGVRGRVRDLPPRRFGFQGTNYLVEVRNGRYTNTLVLVKSYSRN